MKQRKKNNDAWEVYSREKEYNKKKKIGISTSKLLPIAAAVEEWKHSENNARNIEIAEIFVNWKEIVGPGISSHAEIIEISHGRMILSVSDSAWRYQLLFMREEILSKINHVLGARVIKEIVLTG